MALILSIDLTDATFADLATLVDAARTAGVTAHTALSYDDDTNRLVLETDSAAAGSDSASCGSAQSRSHLLFEDHPQRPAPGSGTDAALKFIAQLLGEDRRPRP